MSKPNTYTAQYLGKWHAGFTIGNQSFVLNAHEGTEEEANWYAEMMDKAFAKLRVVEEVKSYLENEFVFGCPSCESVWHKQPRWSKNGKIRTVHYCPGCGAKIKR